MDGDFNFTPSKDKTSFREIALQQLQRVTMLSNVEFRGGYYSIFVDKNDIEKETYVQDTRETFGNAVKALAILLLPKFDDQMMKDYKLYLEQLDKITQQFIEVSTVEEEVVLGEGFYTREKDKIALETYKSKKLYLHLKLFEYISLLLDRKNYLGMMGMTYG